MSQMEPWTHQVSDHVMDAQAIARRMVQAPDSAGGKAVTPAEQAMLDAMHRAQETITDVHAEIVKTTQAMTLVSNAIRYGAQPRRLRVND